MTAPLEFAEGQRPMNLRAALRYPRCAGRDEGSSVYPGGGAFRYDEVPAGPRVRTAAGRASAACRAAARPPALIPNATLHEPLATAGKVVESFRVLEHTADVGFEAFGRSPEEAFANAGRALVSLVVDLDTIRPSQQLALEVEGSDPLSLLVNWLSEILYLHDAEGWLFCDFSVQQWAENKIVAVGRGEKFDRQRHRAKLLLKAITYHQLALEETRQGWRAQVYVDI